ncbi:MAG: zinc-binding dehydrogenase [Chloroflexi bacterium]|nr:MAG: zinc-binding dehydrogenase [Chloroflexota bacterium]TME46073.1 MAG: zinc-binding dehydrogenase [Chloroflexota bacterium]
MKGAGIREVGGPVEEVDLPEPASLKSDEVLIEVQAAGVANWDDLVRTGAWDVGITPPMALGVEAAGTVRQVGAAVSRFEAGHQVLTHSAPLRHQGAWAERFVAPEAHVARKPVAMEITVAGAFGVPALTAYQVLAAMLNVQAGEAVLIHGAGGVTGGMLAAVAAAMGARVIAVAGARNKERLKQFGATAVLDRDSSWQQAAKRLADGAFPAVVNAVRGATASVLPLVADNGRLATITGDPPASERGIRIGNVYVTADGYALERLAADFANRGLTLPVAAVVGLAQGSSALAEAVAGSPGVVVIDPRQA